MKISKRLNNYSKIYLHNLVFLSIFISRLLVCKKMR